MLRLSIENVDRLPDGGPLRIEVKGRGLDLGRDAHLDWTLPDPGRTVSGKHCEIRFRDGGYWLHDVSTNGTFLDGAEIREAYIRAGRTLSPAEVRGELTRRRAARSASQKKVDGDPVQRAGH